MTSSAPASIPASNGGAWVARHSSSDIAVAGRLVCESPSTEPCPGKCLRVDSTVPCSPATAEATRGAAEAASVPSTREKMNEPRIRGHVGDDAEVDRHAGRRHERGARGERRLCGLGRRAAQLGRRRKLVARKPANRRALLVDGDEQRKPRIGAQLRVHGAERGGGARHVVAHVDDAAHPGRVDDRADRGRVGARHVDHEERRDLLGQGHAGQPGRGVGLRPGRAAATARLRLPRCRRCGAGGSDASAEKRGERAPERAGRRCGAIRVDRAWGNPRWLQSTHAARNHQEQASALDRSAEPGAPQEHPLEDEEQHDRDDRRDRERREVHVELGLRLDRRQSHAERLHRRIRQHERTARGSP